MESFSLHLNPKRWIMSGFVLTLPTLLFWSAVAYSVLTRNHKYVDQMLSFGGTFMYVFLVVILPLMSFLVAMLCRIVLRRQAIARNLWHRETPEMRVNQGLINWNLVLISVMIISVINN